MLTIDCGNTTIRCRNSIGEVWTTSTAEPDVESLRRFADGAERAVIVSVVPRALQTVRLTLEPLDTRVEVAGEDLRCPLGLAYDTVATLGADRWLGAYAANRRYGAAVTIDCGTATTVNFVDAGGVFHGGAIAPGLATLAHGLHTSAPALPAADLQSTPPLPATTTQSCVDAGVLIGWVGLVEKLVAEVLASGPAVSSKAGSAQSPVIVVTGGQSQHLLRLTDLRCVHVPLLLHDGLRALAEAGA